MPRSKYPTAYLSDKVMEYAFFLCIQVLWHFKSETDFSKFAWNSH